VFLPAADIPTFVGEGRVDLGITGRDQVAEHDCVNPPTESTGVEEVMDLEFGKCKLQVQVPDKGSISKPEELVGKNIVTSFTNLSEQYFARLEKEATGAEANGEANGDAPNASKTTIKYVGGSVEAACALGVADGIVDLVGMISILTLISVEGQLTCIESGETMRVAGLKAISTVVESTAVLIKSKHPSDTKLINLITSRIRGCITAQKWVLCTYNIPRAKLDQVKSITPGKRAPTITSLEEEDWVAVNVMVENKKIADTMDELEQLGAEDILVTKLENTRTRVS
jgi:ATP phosphoribosyltransferase